MTKTLISSAALLALAGSASALAGVEGFTGYTADIDLAYDDGFGNTWYTVDVYANFDSDDYAVLNLFNSSISTNDGGGFHHNDLADATGGSWKPSFSFDIPGAYDPTRDSYVTIGYGVGALAALNQTALDPGFDPANTPYVPENAGWFNLTPDNAQFASGGQLLVGHFVMNSDRNALTSMSFAAEIGYNTGPGTEVSFGYGSEVFQLPAPGALALLGLGGLAARRRRA